MRLRFHSLARSHHESRRGECRLCCRASRSNTRRCVSARAGGRCSFCRLEWDRVECAADRRGEFTACRPSRRRSGSCGGASWFTLSLPGTRGGGLKARSVCDATRVDTGRGVYHDLAGVPAGDRRGHELVTNVAKRGVTSHHDPNGPDREYPAQRH